MRIHITVDQIEHTTARHPKLVNQAVQRIFRGYEAAREEECMRRP